MKEYAEDTDPDKLCICFDLQKTLPTPKLTSNIAYYKRKMWTYNLAITNIKTGKSVMHMWDEVTAKRGSNEVASCLVKYIEAYLNEYPDTTELVMFSDNCAGQNKNKNITLACLRLIYKGAVFNIIHIFLVLGHSYMPCDRTFGVIETRLRKTNPIVSPDHYASVIAVAAKANSTVTMMKHLILRTSYRYRSML